MEMNDNVKNELIHDDSIWPKIKAKFPNATYEDASDIVHEKRCCISIPNTTHREFHLFLLDEGFHGLSLQFQLLLCIQDNQEFNSILNK